MARPEDPGPFEPIRAEDERAEWFAYRSEKTGRIYLQVPVSDWKQPWKAWDVAAEAQAAAGRRRADVAKLVDLEAKRAAAERLGLVGEAAELAAKIAAALASLTGGTIQP